MTSTGDRQLPAGPVTYVLGGDKTVLIIEAGDRPDGSGVHSFEHVTLRPPFPDGVCERLTGSKPILGYVRVPDGLVDLGRLHVGMYEYERSPDVMTRCRLYLKERLPFDVLDRVRPTAPAPTPSLDWLDAVPHDRIRALREFFATWYADMPATAEAPASVRVQENVPEPLFAFYEAAKGRPELLGTQNRIHAPVVVRPGGMLLFGTENQGGFELLTEADGDDPAVWYVGLADEALVAREPLSGFLLQFALCEAAIGGFGGFAPAGREQVRRLVESLRPVPLRPLRWPTDPTHLYAGPGVVVIVSDCGDGTFEVTVGARHRAALRPFRTPGFEWQSFDG